MDCLLWHCGQRLGRQQMFTPMCESMALLTLRGRWQCPGAWFLWSHMQVYHPFWEWCAVSFLSGSAKQFATETLFVAVKCILFSHFSKICKLNFEMLQYNIGSKHMINKCALPLFLWYITMRGNFLRDSEYASWIYILSVRMAFFLVKPKFAEQWRSLGVRITLFKINKENVLGNL